jgi:hypothetical protein
MGRGASGHATMRARRLLDAPECLGLGCSQHHAVSRTPRWANAVSGSGFRLEAPNLFLDRSAAPTRNVDWIVIVPTVLNVLLVAFARWVGIGH